MINETAYEDRIAELRVGFIWPDDPKEREIIAVALSLAGEAGELANKVKKKYLKGGTHRDLVTVGEILEELGDIQGYSAMLATALSTNLRQVRLANIEKLEARAEERVPR
jgi:NTP pyrophosphatase (non-canonical NTP hydrolase)